MAGAGRKKPSSHRLRVGGFEVRKIGARGLDARDPYHLALTIGWPAFIVWLILVYAAITTVFAAIYMLLPGPITTQDLSSFRNALFFSFEVLSTSGYVGMNPDAVLAKLIATVEIILGLAFIAIMMGLVFVRFSRAKARLILADQAVVATHNGKPTLMIRVGNGRVHALANTCATLNLLVREKTLEGAEFYNLYELPLTRPNVPYFPLILTLMHTIDAKSAMAGLDTAAMAQREMVLFLSFEALDPNLSSTVSAVRAYAPTDVVFGARYVDCVSVDEAGLPMADLGKISLIEPDAAAMAR